MWPPASPWWRIWAVAVGAQTPQKPLPLEPQRERGASITPAYEGWFENADGSFSMLLGYYNRNAKEALDIPVGPNNRIEPGPVDQGQPTHFEIGRQWGVFVVKVPKDFGTKTLTWTIVVERRDAVDPVHPEQGVSDQSRTRNSGMGNQPPVLAFSQGGAKVTGPPIGGRRHLHGNREPAGRDHRLGGGSRRPSGEERRRHRRARFRRRSRPSRCTSSADPAR